jgi:hypothetical protein
MTWDNFPEGDSYGTVVKAENHLDAENLCRQEMAYHRYDGGNTWSSPDEVFESYGDEWHVIDCFDLDHFIVMHTAVNPAAQAEATV